MQSLQSIFTYAFHALESQHPLLPWVILSLIPFVAIDLVKRQFPEAWIWLESIGPESGTAARLFQALPSAIIGAATGALGTGGDPAGAVMGAVVALGSPLLHHLLKALPGPYQGAVSDIFFGDDDDDPKPPPVAAMLLICVALTGCASATPEFNTAEKQCLAKAEAAADLKLVKCGESVSGDCSTDSIIDAQEKEAHSCLERH